MLSRHFTNYFGVVLFIANELEKRTPKNMYRKIWQWWVHVLWYYLQVHEKESPPKISSQTSSISGRLLIVTLLLFSITAIQYTLIYAHFHLTEQMSTDMNNFLGQKVGDARCRNSNNNACKQTSAPKRQPTRPANHAPTRKLASSSSDALYREAVNSTYQVIWYYSLWYRL